MNARTTKQSDTASGKRKGPAYLPGDRQHSRDVDAMIRVDHAGEYGATRIYKGQIDILGKGEKGPMLRHMAEQEQVHLDTFNEMIAKRRVRPTILTPFWHVAGYALGAGTALLGEKAAMACTVAIEEVIDEHYADQAEALEDREPELKAVIEKFRAEEIQHRDIGYEHDAADTPAFPVLTSAIKTASRVAIWLSERF